MYNFVTDLPEDGIQGPKHVGGASRNNEYLWFHVQLIGSNTVLWIFGSMTSIHNELLRLISVE